MVHREVVRVPECLGVVSSALSGKDFYRMPVELPRRHEVPQPAQVRREPADGHERVRMIGSEAAERQVVARPLDSERLGEPAQATQCAALFPPDEYQVVVNLVQPGRPGAERSDGNIQ